MARAATSPELALFRSSGQWTKIRAAIYAPTTVYTARINQVFSSLDKVLELTYDTGSGTLADVLADMTLFVGSSAGAWDKGIARVRSIDATKIYIGETSDISFADNDYLTIVDDFSLWARPILISGGVAYIDGGEAYSDQHSSWLPVARMGPNRVIKKTGATVSVSFDFSGSSAQGSSISAYLTTAPGSTGITGSTTATPSVTWDSVGWKKVYLTLTAANGKQDFGVRYVFIWDETNEPEPIRLDSLRGSVESGGWEASITLFDNASLSLVRDRTRVILFAEDHYGPYDGETAQEVGPVTGAENILFDGWIARESIDWDSEGGSVSFTAYSAQYWLTRIPSWPFGVEFTSTTPTAWTQIQSLTVDLALLSFFLFASTAPRVMDIYLTGDTRFAKELGSLASNLWGQIVEIAFDTIFARPLVNCLNQLYIEVNPQLVATGSRSWPTVMTLTTQDIERPVSFERSTLEDLALLDLSGVFINSSGSAEAFFSLAPGHSYSHYGDPEVIPKRLLSSQSQANTLAGLYRSWRNNPYKGISIRLSGNNRLVDIAPRQKCNITLSSSDTKRGVSYSGGLIPIEISRAHDPDTGFLKTEVLFEGETFEGRAQNGDVPGSVNISFPPLKPLPKLPPFSVILPGTSAPPPEGVSRVLIHDRTAGLVYTENFDAASPTWQTVNAGLTQAEYQRINFLAVCPNGAVYAGYIANNTSLDFLSRAPSIGGTFVAQTYPNELVGAAINPLVSEQIAIVTNTGHGTTATFRIGANNSFSAPGATFNVAFLIHERLSYGFGKWIFTHYDTFTRIAGDGSSVVGTGSISPSSGRIHHRAGTTGITFHNGQLGASGDVIKGIDNLASHSTVNSGNSIIVMDENATFPAMAMDSDPTGQYLMSRGLGGLGQGKARSSDGGATWVAIPNLISSAGWHFRNAGASNRWIAVAATIQYTEDFGDSWTAKNGNITGITPFPNIDMVRFIE